MKNLNRFIYSVATTIFVMSMILTFAEKSFAQSCNQIEIIYQELDCAVKEQHSDVGSPGSGCKMASACDRQSYSYSAGIGSWASYNWTVSGPAAVTINPNNTVSNITIVWPVQGNYTLTLTVTDMSGNIFTTCLTVNVKAKPVANFSFFPNNVCAGSTISFTNGTTSTGGVVYSWDFGDPLSGALNFSSGINPTHTFNSMGNYTVTLIAASFVTVTTTGGNGQQTTVIKTCCADTIQKVVNIVAGSINIECISTVCAGATVTYTAVGCANPTWFPPTGGTIINQSGNQVTIQWGNGVLQGVIKAQCPGGCIASVPVPIIPLNPQPAGNLNPCTNSSTSYTLPVLPGTFYTWHLDDMTPTNYDYLLITFPDNNTVWIDWSLLPQGTYQLSVDLDNKHLCCSSKGKITIISNVTFTAYYDQTVCKGSAANLSVNPVAGTFTWNIVPAAGVVPPTGSGSSFSPVFNIPGNYVATVTETAGTYCISTQQVKIKVVNTPLPGTIVGPFTACPGSQYSYSISTPAPSGFYYDWQIVPPSAGTFQPGSMTTTSGNSVTVSWTSLPASLQVVLQRTTAPLCPSAPVIQNISQATIGTITGQQNACVDDEYIYTLAGGNLPAGENVQWSISLPSFGTVVAGQGTNNPKIKWHGQTVGSGPWTATVTATSNCGITSTSVTISKKPLVTLSQSGNICLGGVTLTATGAGPYTYLWSNGANTASTTVTSAGVYTVTVTSASCSIIRTIEVKDPFYIRPLSCGVGYCNGTGTNEQLGVEVTQPGTGTFTYEWYSGVYPSGSLLTTVTNNVTINNYTATSPGSYYVIVKYGTCQKYAAFTVKKVCCPDINLPNITTVTQLSCNTYTFTGTTPNPNGASITWSFGDGATQAGVSGVPVTHTYVHAGVYCVTFCVGPPVPNPTSCTGNCAATSVTVPIEALFTYTLGCNGCVTINDMSLIYGNPGFVSYFWDFGDGFTTTSAVPPVHCYSMGGTYTILLTLTYNNGIIPACTNTASMQATYVPLSITMNSPVCTGQLVNMSSTPGGFLTYAWNFGDTYSSYTSPTTHAYNLPGPKSVSLTVTDILGNTCMDTANVTVYPGISGCTLLPAFICPGGAALLTAATGAGYTYQWEQAVGGVYVAPNPNSITNTLTVNTPGWYHVIIANANGCLCKSDSVEVKAVPKPKAIIAVSPSSHICGSDNVMFTSVNELPGFTSEWYANGNFGTLLYTGSMFYVAGLNVTTNYSLVLTNQYGCKDTCTMTVYVNPIPAQPVVVSNPSGVLCEGIPITLTVTNYTGNITWSNGAIGTSITVSAAGVYTATYTDPLTGCSSKKNIVVNRRPPLDLFPHFCDSIPCNCIRPFTIYAPLPLLGPGAVTYNIQWYNPALVGSGPVLNNVNTGTYYVVATDPGTGCSSTSLSYSVKVPSCDTCSCKESSWQFVSLEKAVDAVPAKNNISNNNVPQIVKLECKGVYTLLCNQPYTIKAGFKCGDTSCTAKVTYQLLLPDNTTQSGNVPFTFTPVLQGSYTLTLYGWCGNSICDSCKITFKVECKTECDCKNSHWGEITLATGPSKKVIKCNTLLKLKCNQPFTINANYICTGANCSGVVTYTLTPPVGSPLSGTLPLTYTPTQTGVYTLQLNGMCGNVVCDHCIFDIKVECPVEESCCPHEKEIQVLGMDNTITQQTFAGNNYSLYTANISISGGPTPYQEIKATVIDYQLIANYEECIACKNKPFTWSSISGGIVAGIVPATTGASPTVGFNIPANPTENPREIVWANGSPINLATPQNVAIQLYLPVASALPCCELKAKVCIKFTFKDINCKLCEKIVCGTVLISKTGVNDQHKEQDSELFKK